MKHHNPISTNIHKEVLAAEKRIRPHIRKTYLEYSPYLSSKVDGRVYLKLECMQHTGSFKYRGALNKFLSLSPEDYQRPVITASSGNHGTAFAAILQKFGGKGIVYLPENASPAKVNITPRDRKAPKLCPAEPINLIWIVSSGKPANPYRLAIALLSIVPTVRFVFLILQSK